MMQSDAVQPAAAVPKPRSPGLDFDARIPRHWFGNNVVGTHVVNGVNLLFPAGERFFVRSVNRYLDRVDDPLLREQIKGFFGQEGRHAKEHERFFAVLEGQGYRVRRFLRVYEAICYGVVERIAPASLALATTAACEHFTAILAEHALREKLLDLAHPTMQALLLWHASEEIEHRAVAFDVLRQAHPSYALRIAGLAVAGAFLGVFWAAATVMLLAQEKKWSARRLGGDYRVARERSRGRSVFRRGLREYLRRGFHPSQSDTDGLAAAYLAKAGLA
jgi:predicted metal-dependent hydrolase